MPFKVVPADPNAPVRVQVGGRPPKRVEPPKPEATVYYQLDDGGAVARLRDGWERQIWNRRRRAWMGVRHHFDDEGRYITEQDAADKGADVSEGAATDDFGEFASDDQEDE